MEIAGKWRKMAVDAAVEVCVPKGDLRGTTTEPSRRKFSPYATAEKMNQGHGC